MKKGFTLVELLVVVVVIVTLMAITFRLAGVGGDSTARNRTIARMQRLENCLSGYYAAFGSYPPVALHGSRDYTYEVDKWSGVQNIGENGRTAGNIANNWKSVEAACRSQPMAFSFPYPESMKGFVEAYCNHQRESDSSIPQYSALYDNSSISTYENKTAWTECQIYKYGVMSYLMPRLLVTMNGGMNERAMDSQIFSRQQSWTENNDLPTRMEDGAPYTSWSAVNDDAHNRPWKIAALPSQAVCARWMPNLEKSVVWLTQRNLYGIDISDPYDRNIPSEIYFIGPYGSRSQPYKLNTITVVGGYGYWDSDRHQYRYDELYYYSPAPYQTYRLWSAGANCKTFPPWITDEELNKMNAQDRETVQTWLADDLVHMSN